MIIEDVAEIVHNLNQQYSLALGQEVPDWADTDDLIKQSIVSGIQAVLNDTEITNEKSHENWLEIKVSEGWKYGEKKDSKLKTHPNLVSYDKMPKEEKVRDYLFLSIVKSLLPYLQGSEHRAAMFETGRKAGYTEAKEEILNALNKPYERRRS